MILELPASLPPHDPDRRECTDDGNIDRPSNGENAASGFAVIKHTRNGASDESDFEDLITNLLHTAHSQDFDPLEIIRSAVVNFLAEAAELPPST